MVKVVSKKGIGIEFVWINGLDKFYVELTPCLIDYKHINQLIHYLVNVFSARVSFGNFYNNYKLCNY